MLAMFETVWEARPLSPGVGQADLPPRRRPRARPTAGVVQTDNQTRRAVSSEAASARFGYRAAFFENSRRLPTSSKAFSNLVQVPRYGGHIAGCAAARRRVQRRAKDRVGVDPRFKEAIHSPTVRNSSPMRMGMTGLSLGPVS